MTRWRTVLVTASLALASSSVRVSAQRAQMPRYYLVEPSTFQQGCMAPCDCPVLAFPIRGTFRLLPASPGPLFTEFAVARVRWRARPSQPGALKPIRIRGSGIYRIGGEFAIEQQLALDLTIGTQGLMHLDSGIVPGGGEFPARIDVPISTNSGCMGTTIDVHAVQGRPHSGAPFRSLTPVPNSDERGWCFIALPGERGACIGSPSSSSLSQCCDIAQRIASLASVTGWCPAEQLDPSTGQCSECRANPCEGIPTPTSGTPPPTAPPAPRAEGSCFISTDCSGPFLPASQAWCCEQFRAGDFAPLLSWCPDAELDPATLQCAACIQPCEGLPTPTPTPTPPASPTVAVEGACFIASEECAGASFPTTQSLCCELLRFGELPGAISWCPAGELDPSTNQCGACTDPCAGLPTPSPVPAEVITYRLIEPSTITFVPPGSGFPPAPPEPLSGTFAVVNVPTANPVTLFLLSIQRLVLRSASYAVTGNEGYIEATAGMPPGLSVRLPVSINAQPLLLTSEGPLDDYATGNPPSEFRSLTMSGDGYSLTISAVHEPADLHWYTACGPPVVAVDGEPCPDSVTRCTTERLGEPCNERGATCCKAESGCTFSICNSGLICSTEPPLTCPISRRRYKQDIEYVGPAALRQLHDELLAIKLATYRYKNEASGAPAHLGFIIEDVEPSPSVDSAHDMVDLYGYLSMAVGTLQVQAKQIEALQKEIQHLREELKDSRQ